MSKRFVTVDRDAVLLLPVDLREWVPSEDPVHSVPEVTGQTPTDAFHFVKELGLAKVSVDGTLIKANERRGVMRERELQSSTGG